MVPFMLGGKKREELWRTFSPAKHRKEPLFFWWWMISWLLQKIDMHFSHWPFTKLRNLQHSAKFDGVALKYRPFQKWWTWAWTALGRQWPEKRQILDQRWSKNDPKRIQKGLKKDSKRTQKGLKKSHEVVVLGPKGWKLKHELDLYA